MKFLIVAAFVAVAAAAPPQTFNYQPAKTQFAYQPTTYTAQPAAAVQQATYTAQQATYTAQPATVQTAPAFTYSAKPTVVATITKTVTKPVTYQVPVATITRNSEAAVVESAAPQYRPTYTTAPQYTATQAAQPYVAIVKLERNQQPSGDYNYFYQAENGIQASEKAVIKAVRDEKNEEHYVPNVEGSYSYTGPDGVVYTVNYVADEYGFRASGAHLPVAPQAQK